MTVQNLVAPLTRFSRLGDIESPRFPLPLRDSAFKISGTWLLRSFGSSRFSKAQRIEPPRFPLPLRDSAFKISGTWLLRSFGPSRFSKAQRIEPPRFPLPLRDSAFKISGTWLLRSFGPSRFSKAQGIEPFACRYCFAIPHKKYLAGLGKVQTSTLNMDASRPSVWMSPCRSHGTGFKGIKYLCGGLYHIW